MAANLPPNVYETATIDPGAIASVHLALYQNAGRVSTGTGFIVSHDGVPFLVTNYHVLSGINPETGEIKGIRPDRVLVAVMHTNKSGNAAWSPCVQRVLDDNEQPLWVEHPVHGRDFDVVALPLELSERATYFDWTTPDGPRPALGMGSEVFIAGFPHGVSGAGGTTIWKTGNIASELTLPINGKDFFWIDALTREGMSGSPVLARRVGMYAAEPGAYMVMPNTSSPRTRHWLLGVYAGRATADLDMTMGRVWRWRTVLELLEYGCGRVRAGKVAAAPTTLGTYRSAEATISVIRGAVELRGRSWTVADLLRLLAERDPRLGASLRRVTLTAEILAACEGADHRAIYLTTDQYDLVTSVLGSSAEWVDDNELWQQLDSLRSNILNPESR